MFFYLRRDDSTYVSFSKFSLSSISMFPSPTSEYRLAGRIRFHMLDGKLLLWLPVLVSVPISLFLNLHDLRVLLGLDGVF